jgi:hypothetical protein
MLFLHLTEKFFKQFHFILGVDPKLALEHENFPFPQAVPKTPQDYWQLINDYNIDVDFNVVAEIMKLKAARKKDDISIEDALDLFEEARRKHWFVDDCELVEYHTIIKDEYCEFIGGFLKKDAMELDPHLSYEIIEENFREWICKYSEIRTQHFKKLIRGIQNQPILDGTEKDPEPSVIKNINRKGTMEDEKLKEELIIKPDSKEFFEKADRERGGQKLKNHIEKENEILNTLGNSIKEASNKTQAQTLGDRIPVEKMVDSIKKMFESSDEKEALNKKESTIEIQFKNNFNNKSYDFIYDHFKEGLVDGDREYLSEDKLKEWIEDAFVRYPNPPKERYVFTNVSRKKLKIYLVFYKFYHKCGLPNGDSKKYASLCGDYFEGNTTQTVEANWQKQYNKS